MIEAAIARATLDKVRRPSFLGGVTFTKLAIPSTRSFSFLDFPQQHTSGKGGQTVRQCLPPISAGSGEIHDLCNR
jgi:hypothetical protein